MSGWSDLLAFFAVFRWIGRQAWAHAVLTCGADSSRRRRVQLPARAADPPTPPHLQLLLPCFRGLLLASMHHFETNPCNLLPL